MIVHKFAIFLFYPHQIFWKMIMIEHKQTYSRKIENRMYWIFPMCQSKIYTTIKSKMSAKWGIAVLCVICACAIYTKYHSGMFPIIGDNVSAARNYISTLKGAFGSGYGPTYYVNRHARHIGFSDTMRYHYGCSILDIQCGFPTHDLYNLMDVVNVNNVVL